MSTEYYFVSNTVSARALATGSEIAAAFGDAVSGSGDGELHLGHSSQDQCDLGFTEDPLTGMVTDFTVNRPTDYLWLWQGMYDLLRDYDYVLITPADDIAAVAGRAGVPLPEGFDEAVVVAGPAELRELLTR